MRRSFRTQDYFLARMSFLEAILAFLSFIRALATGNRPKVPSANTLACQAAIRFLPEVASYRRADAGLNGKAQATQQISCPAI